MNKNYLQIVKEHQDQLETSGFMLNKDGKHIRMRTYGGVTGNPYGFGIKTITIQPSHSNYYWGGRYNTKPA